MSDNNKSIHDFELKLICDYFSSVKRQGPGNEEITLKALSFIENLPTDAQMADIGCGTGTQTITLAQATSGHITALDLFPDFINILKEEIIQENLTQRITPLVGSMAELPFEQESLDLIWAEGSIYNIGFENGINYCKQFLKTGGYIAVSEGTWFTAERPAEIEKFWMDNYPEIDIVSTKVAQMEKAGYIPIATFNLPDSCWLDDFYGPMEEAREAFLLKYPDSDVARDLVASQRHEEALYRKYRQYYGYTFYIGKKI